MSRLPYTVIKTRTQYKAYCKVLEALIDQPHRKDIADEIDLLTLLIEKWDHDHSSQLDLDPVQLLISFMDDHGMKATDLVQLLGVSKGYISDILHYKKGLSKEIIRELATHFKVAQEAFNRPYALKILSMRPKPSRRRQAFSPQSR